LKIIITYNNDEYYENFDDDNVKIKKQANEKGENITDTVGYRAIPIDYIQPIMETIDYKQFAILSVLFARYSYYTIKKCNDENGEYYLYNQNYYAFPTYEQISKHTGISESVCLRKIKQLIDNQYKIIDYYNDHIITTRFDKRRNKFAPMAKNNVYYIYLFQQPEYVYYHLYKVEDKKEKTEAIKKKLKEIHNKNSKLTFENIATENSEGKENLTDQDYIKYYHGYVMKSMDECLKTKNKENYIQTVRPEKIYLSTQEKERIK
jgi:DNA-binding Lrp family transcriptional regulator